MNVVKHRYVFPVIFGIIALVCLVSVNRGENDQTNSSSTESSITNAIGSILLQLEYESGRIKNKDPIPPLRIYEDGLVLVHFPQYTIKAGDYRLQLKEEELEEVRGWMRDSDLREGLEESIRSQRHIAVQARRAASVKPVAFRTILDRSTTVIKYRLAAAEEARISGLEKVSCYDLRNEAAQFPEITALAKLAELEKKLQGITKRDDLVKIVE